MFKNFSGFLNIFKDNKKLLYACNIFIALIVLSFVLKLDGTKGKSDILESKTMSNTQISNTTDVYTDELERRVEEIIKQIEGVSQADVMIYTRHTPKLEPVYDENTSSETNIEIGSDGVKREIKRDTNQKQVKMGNNNQVIEKYYQYPDISGVLVVVNYIGNKNINKILMNSIKTLLNIEINNIEIVISNNLGVKK